MFEAGATVREIAMTLKIGRGTVQRFLAQKPTGSATSQPVENLLAAIA